MVILKGHLLCHLGVRVAPGHVPQSTRAHGMVLTPIEELPELGFCVSGCFRRRVAEETLAA